jgi:glycosyltransferase involved in cell wall biosynthesis
VSKTSKIKVAIVCDWLVGMGGAERVVLELHKLYPEAPIYTSQYNPKKINWFNDADVRTTWLQHLPFSLRKFLPPLRAWAFSHLNLSDYDLVISSSGAEAKAVKIDLETTHICYCHSVTHYYWIRYEEYLKQPGFGRLNWLARFGLKVLVGPMRRWDRKAAQRPNYLITNSTFSQSQIQKYYGRTAAVIHPPVDIERFQSTDRIVRKGFIIAGRQTPYKRFDLAVAACTKLSLPLIVIGNGPEHEKLVAMAGSSITFLTDVADSEIAPYFKAAEAFIFPGIDDFGIVAVEALAAGTPVVAYNDGGSLDYIKDGKTGLFFDKQTVSSLVSVLQKIKTYHFNHSDIVTSAQQFSETSFRAQLKDFIDKVVDSSL